MERVDQLVRKNNIKYKGKTNNTQNSKMYSHTSRQSSRTRSIAK